MCLHEVYGIGKPCQNIEMPCKVQCLIFSLIYDFYVGKGLM